MVKKVFLSAIICAVFTAVSAAQDTLAVPKTLEERYEAFVKYLSPEKVYIHTDRDVYGIGDTIWFKGYIVNSSPLSDYPESKYIYVEVVGNTVAKNIKDRFEDITYAMQRVKVKLRNNVLEGYLAIPEDANTGYATVRGYTYWNLNKDPEYVFRKEITIINPIKDNYVSELEKKKIRNDSAYEELGVENPFHLIKRVKTLDCAFLPESGRLLVGVSNRIGVKVIGSDGLGKQSDVEIFDHNNQPVASFSTDEYGFGSFRLSPVSGNENYYAKVKDNEGTAATAKLPAVEQDGVSISLTLGKDVIEASVSVCGKVKDSDLRFLLTGSSEIYCNMPLNGSARLNLPIEGMPSGINNAVVCDVSGNVLAKRPFFVMPDNLDREVKIYVDDDNIGKRENIGVEIDLGCAKGGSFSASVTDDFLTPVNTLNNNIISYMFLSSEIRGNVENPQRFFCDTIPLDKRMADLDLLLMTQGWEYYDLPAVLAGKYPMPQYGREYVQSVSGQVKTGLLKRKKDYTVFFVAPTINFAVAGTVAKDGYFELKDVDFPDSTRFIVSASNKYSTVRYRTVLFDDAFARFTKFVHQEKKVKYTPEVAKILTENYYSTGGDMSYQLNAITVYGRKRSIKGLSPFSNWEFRSDQIRDGKKLEPYQSYDMITYLAMTCPGLREKEVVIDGIPQKILVAAGRQGKVPVYINGMRMMNWWELNSLSVGDVEAVVYLRGGESAMYDYSGGGYGNSNRIGGTVLVKTKPIVRMVWYITSGMPLGWQKPKSFYSPKYEIEGKDLIISGADKRPTLYWNPSLSASSDGHISFRFNSSDLLRGYTVTVEGITSGGEYVSRRFSIK